MHSAIRLGIERIRPRTTAGGVPFKVLTTRAEKSSRVSGPCGVVLQSRVCTSGQRLSMQCRSPLLAGKPRRLICFLFMAASAFCAFWDASLSWFTIHGTSIAPDRGAAEGGVVHNLAARIFASVVAEGCVCLCVCVCLR